MKRSAKTTLGENGEVLVQFFENYRMIGTIDYSAHSQHYIEDALENWQSGILSVETVKAHDII